MQPGDDELLRKAQGGDRSAFSELVRRHQAGVRALAARLLFAPDDVFDLAQETFVRAWRHLDRCDPTRPFGPWVRTVCRNLIANHIRDGKVARTRAQRIVDEILVETPVLDAALAEVDDDQVHLAHLSQCLGRLNPAQRELIDWRYRSGLSVPEIGARTGRTTAGVAMALSRLRALLSRCLEELAGAAPHPEAQA